MLFLTKFPLQRSMKAIIRGPPYGSHALQRSMKAIIRGPPHGSHAGYAWLFRPAARLGDVQL
ncbi:hypothetical protein BMJ22_25895 [Sinorhizobium medicae]|nr:hypothetical protein BMJ22_25895 [Sinorhizobium medicae]